MSNIKANIFISAIINKGEVRVDLETNEKYIYFGKLDVKSNFNKIKDLDARINELDINMSKTLIDVWNRNGWKSTMFGEFIRRYEDYIYTKEILKLVYDNTDLKGKFDDWYRRNRCKMHIELYTKEEIKEYVDCNF